MTFSWYTRVLLALASGVTLALSFPNYNLPLLAWVSIALLVLASYGARLRVAPLYGFLHGLVFYPICLPWMDVVMRQYGDVGPWTSAGILGLVGIAGGIICAVFSWGVALASRKGTAFACALAPFLWVTLEFLRGNLPIIAFPWNLIGYAASGNLALVQLTAITGIYGLSFLVAGYGAVAGIRDSFGAPPRVAVGDRDDRCADSHRHRWALSRAERDTALRRASRANGLRPIL